MLGFDIEFWEIISCFCGCRVCSSGCVALSLGFTKYGSMNKMIL